MIRSERMWLYETNTVFVQNEKGNWKKTTTGQLTVGVKVLAPDAIHPMGWVHEDGSPRVLVVTDVDGGKRRIGVRLI